MFFITKSIAWLAIGFLIVRPALFDDAVSDSGASIKQGAIHVARAAGSGFESSQHGETLNGEIVKFCLDRNDLCKQTTSAIGEMIVGSVSSMHQKEHKKSSGFAFGKSYNNKEPFVPMPRMRPVNL